jgi:hypothetical protein
MENAGVQKKQTEETASVSSAVWDPFWFMRQLFGWWRIADAPSFEVKETDDTYVCKARVKLTLPEHADVARATAELDGGELTLLVPKATSATPEPASPPRRAPRARGNRSGSAGRKPRRGARTRARRG